MTTTRLSSKGQVILPKAIRDAHGWRAGLEFSIEDRDGGVLLRPLAYASPKTVDDLLGCVRYRGPRRTIEEMDAGVLEEAKRHR